MNKSTLLFTGILMAAFGALAQQGSINAANKLYQSKLYSQAIPVYTGVLKKDSNNVDVLSNLGDCYRLTNNTQGQLLCYGRLVRAGKAEDVHKLYYGQALMKSGRYDEAKKYMDEARNDERGAAFSSAINNMQKFSKDADAYKVDTVSFNSKFNDFSAIPFEKDQVIFTSTRSKTSWISYKHGWTDNNYCHMYITQKSDGKYEKPEVFMEEFSTKYNDGPFSISKDGKTLFFTRNSTGKKGKSLDGAQKLHIYQATVDNGNITSMMELKLNNKEFNCAHPAISADGKTLYFASDMGGGQGGMDIWYCKLGSDGSWGTPLNMGNKVNTPGNEIFPFISPDNLLYFSSDGREGIGGLDVFETKIKDYKPGSVYNMGKPVNSEFDDFAYNVYDDGKKAFLSSNRKHGGMDDDIYTVDILRKVARGKTVNFVIKDSETQEPLPAVKIKMNADSFMTNEKGEFQYVMEEDVEYAVSIGKEKYFEIKDTMSSKRSPGEDEFTKDIQLVKDPNLSLLAGIYDARTGAGIEGVKITLKDLVAGNTFELIKTEKNGEYRKPLTNKKVGDKLLYLVTIEKEGYITKTTNFTYDIKKEGEIQLNELLGLTIGKVEVGADLAKMIDIKPIYFDLGKSTIRPDAGIELDKIVEVMKKYPKMIIELGAHTDCRGAAAANLKLSSARAKASAAYIIKKGIDKNRITGRGYGESKLLNTCACEGKTLSNCAEEEHAKNRRTEFIIVKLQD